MSVSIAQVVMFQKNFSVHGRAERSDRTCLFRVLRRYIFSSSPELDRLTPVVTEWSSRRFKACRRISRVKCLGRMTIVC